MTGWADWWWRLATRWLPRPPLMMPIPECPPRPETPPCSLEHGQVNLLDILDKDTLARMRTEALACQEKLKAIEAEYAERAANPPVVRSGEVTGFSLTPGYVSPALKAAIDMERLQRDAERRASGLEMG